MCSKNADLGTSRSRDPASTTAARLARWRVPGFADSWRRQSIARRLTLHYAVWTAALLCLATGILYWTLKHSLNHARYGMLASKVEVLAALVKAPDKAAVLASEVEHEAAESQPFKYYFRLLDEQGRRLLETPDMSPFAPSSMFPPPVEAGDDPRRGIQRVVSEGRTLLLLSVHLPTGTPADGLRTLQATLDVSSGAALLASYANHLLMVLVAGTALAAVAGAWIARQGLRPLVEITRTARHITASQLHERIADRGWPAELAELAAAFDAMLDRLGDSFGRLSQFSGDLAHELRTPVNNLRGEAEVALARARSVAEYQHVLASSLEELERLARMIDGLLFIARADNPHAELHCACFPARVELEAVATFYEALAAEKRVRVACVGNAPVCADPSLFRRAISNLLANALRHTPSGGDVRLAAQALPDGAAQVTVADSGEGIAPEHLPHVFDRFFRGDQARAGGGEGSGLGLAIVQSIMRLHGGTASAHSEPGAGTAFTLRFPAGAAAAAADKMTKM